MLYHLMGVIQSCDASGITLLELIVLITVQEGLRKIPGMV